MNPERGVFAGIRSIEYGVLPGPEYVPCSTDVGKVSETTDHNDVEDHGGS